MKFDVLKNQEVYSHGHLKFQVQQVRLPDGQVIDKAVIGHPGSVAIVPFLEDGQVVMVRQFRLAAGKELLEIPAGTREEGETPRACAERELQEEDGYKPGTLISLGGVYPAPGFLQEYMHLFLARDLVPGQGEADVDEFIEVVTMPLKAALEKITSGEIEDAKTILGLLRAQAYAMPG